MDNSYVKFMKGTAAQYADISIKDPSTIYMLTDAHELYIGNDQLYQVKSVDLDAKQDKLNAGNNITIDSSSSISAIDTTYVAGANIEINDVNEISAKGYSWENGVFSVAGSIESSAGFFETSDARKKTVKEELSLSKAYNLLQICSPIVFTLINDEQKKERIGFIAQQVQAYFPEIVETLPDGTLTLDYAKMSVILFSLVKDMHKRLQTLENK